MITTSGRPVVSQCAMALAATASSSGMRPIISRSSEPSSWSVANSRSSASRLASSAPSHRIAGPMRASSARSGPIANGIMVTTIRKNSAPISAPPPTRTASRMSRSTRADKRAHAGPILSSRGAFEPDRPMRGGDDHAAAGEMAAHQLGQPILRRHVERRGRLVQQPDRPLHRDQPRDRQPPPLPGRQIGRRQVGERRQIDRSSAASTVAAPSPRYRAQNCRFSPTVSDGFSASWWPR